MKVSNMKIIKGIILSVSLVFPGVNSGVVAALESQSLEQISQNNENSSDIDKAKNWRFRDLEGRVIELAQFKGKVIFLNIWATWCRPCIYEMKSIQKLYDAFKNEDVVFIIASDEDKSIVQRFYETYKYTFPVYTIYGPAPRLFRSPGIPSTFIIDRKGNIALRHMGAVDWNQKSSHKLIRSLLSDPDSSENAKHLPDSDNSLIKAKLTEEQQIFLVSQ